jgi:hypothetical protein
VRVVAALLALLTITAALVALAIPEPGLSAEARRLARFVRVLVALQGPDGAFEPEPDAPDLPEVLRTFPHALATAALARAHALDLAAEVPGLDAARDRALDVLSARQKPGGGFGGLPPSAGNRWPGVNAIAGGVLAFSLAARPGDAEPLRGALAALERSAAYELRDGWTRGVVALALHAARARGALALIGRDPTGLLAVGEPDEEPGCRDEQVAEALVRRVRGLPGGYADAVVAACAAREPVWLGERSDLQAWWMQAFLAARSPAGARWLGLYREALDEALEVAPPGRIGGGWYADEVTRTACAVLGLAEGLAPLGPGPFPGLEEPDPE